jgi:hypothetical protein
MIEAQDVAGGQRPAHPFNPPIVAAGPQHVPAIQRISPALSGNAKGIGRHTGNRNGLEVGIELENIRMGPHVGAVVADENGNIANDLDATRSASRMQGAPLFEERKLNGCRDLHFDVQFCTRSLESARLATRQFLRPQIPTHIAVPPPQVLK